MSFEVSLLPKILFSSHCAEVNDWAWGQVTTKTASCEGQVESVSLPDSFRNKVLFHSSFRYFKTPFSTWRVCIHVCACVHARLVTLMIAQPPGRTAYVPGVGVITDVIGQAESLVLPTREKNLRQSTESFIRSRYGFPGENLDFFFRLLRRR